MTNGDSRVRTGWVSLLARIGLAALLFEVVTGLAITLAPFHPTVQWGLVLHTVVGVVTLLPLAWYYVVHWVDYRRYALSHIVLLGYVGVIALFLVAISGIVVTWQGFFGIRTSGAWRQVHLITTIVAIVASVPHILLVYVRVRRSEEASGARRLVWESVGATAVGIVVLVVLSFVYQGPKYVNEFPEDYSYLYGEDRPFAPSLAQTESGGAYDARSLANSESCGTSRCHTQIVEEWQPSVHRWAAMDTIFQAIQSVMAKQNGPESTRYCGGCHDPISLFSGTKNIFVKDLTNLQGYQEGISCLVCHSIRKTDLQGNANYVITQPSEYLWQWQSKGVGRVARDFLIRTYPGEHNKLSKRMFKAPEYCAACHKQFVDKEVNRVGWVQLQNQYDNWAASHWNTKGDPTKTIECRECHMPLVDSTDPAAGDPSDYNRSPDDGKHRSHRFIASNNMQPMVLKLPGWEKQVELTRKWLEGKYDIPEIADKWAGGPIVQMALDLPETASPGEDVPLRVILTSNKVGHDFPTGPLDIIQSWVEVKVTDSQGNTVFTSGMRDEDNFIEPGSFLFKAEPVDQYGNLIDRHNLWEMVGVRYRRALFPGYSDTAEYTIPVRSVTDARSSGTSASGPGAPVPELVSSTPIDTYQITARLLYRKVDQFLLNFLFGKDAGLTSPVVELARATGTIQIEPKPAEDAASPEAAAAPALTESATR